MAVTDINSLTYGDNTFNLKDPTKYAKPAGGIPQSDLEQTVQNKLDKSVVISPTQPTETENKLWVDTDAGSGNSYQVPTVAESLAMGINGAKVGDLVRVNSIDATGKPTSWKHVPLNEIKCNKNLLDNWYFVGGGSQLGYGVFPINQRGQATYSGTGNGIDRWLTQQVTNTSITLNEDGLILSARSNDGIRINLPFSKLIEGQTYTISLLCENNILLSRTAILSTTVTRYLYNNSNIWYFAFGKYGNKWSVWAAICYDQTENKNITIKAAKLELGSEQTLAHNEGTETNPIWVLNETPNYGEELAKCQRYFERLSGAYSLFGTGIVTNASMCICLAFVKPKIKTVSITSETPINGTIYYNDATHLGANAIAGTSFSNLTCYPDGRLQVTLRGFNGLTAGTPCMFTFRDTASYFDISAEP